MYNVNRKSLLIALGFVLSAAAQAETPVNQADAAADKAASTPAIQAPAMPYNYAYPGPVYNRSYYPQNRQAFNNRHAQRFNGRNDWYGNNRMEHMNRAVSDMISDMFGDTAGDFEFDMKIKFKAKGKGKGKASGRGYSDSRMQQRYNGNYRGNYQGRGNYYGGGNSYQYQGYRGYGYPAYAPAASATPAPTMNTSYPPQPAAKSQPESTSPKDK